MRTYKGGEEPRVGDRVHRDTPFASGVVGQVLELEDDGRCVVRWRGRFLEGDWMSSSFGRSSTTIMPDALVLVSRRGGA